MKPYRIYPEVGKTKLNDQFWVQYLDQVRVTMLPYSLEQFEKTGYFKNFESLAKKDGSKHIGPPFSDGLVLETLRGACDLLAIQADPELEAQVDALFTLILSAADEDGFLCTQTQQDYPHKRWGHNDGDIVVQHDLYDHGCLVEAAISHYKATGKTFVLKAAVKAANLIVNTIGPEPKLNIVPGHSLPEEAFVKLYRLFRDDPKLEGFAVENGVNKEAYLDMAEFWYDARGNHEGRCMCKILSDSYNQDHLPFADQREAMGHSVRAMLCYLGAAAVAREKGREDYLPALKALWDNVVYKKLHITGGIGARHDIEGFDVNYNLPNKAYLETCAAIGLAFWNTEMNLIEPDAHYFDTFERSLYNNVLSAVGEDFTHFFYQNPLESDGTLRRWAWHGCPCCPPMLLKLYSALHSFIYAYDKEEKELFVNLWLDSGLETKGFKVAQKDGTLVLDSKGKPMSLWLRVPEYVESFTLTRGGKPVDYQMIRGYAVVKDVFSEDEALAFGGDWKLQRVFANPKVEEDLGKVAFTWGPYVLCAEGIDNGGETEFVIGEDPELWEENGLIHGKRANGGEFTLHPYYSWCNRGEGETDARMAVWFTQENMLSKEKLAEIIGDGLYAAYTPENV